MEREGSCISKGGDSSPAYRLQASMRITGVNTSKRVRDRHENFTAKYVPEQIMPHLMCYIVCNIIRVFTTWLSHFFSLLGKEKFANYTSSQRRLTRRQGNTACWRYGYAVFFCLWNALFDRCKMVS